MARKAHVRRLMRAEVTRHLGVHRSIVGTFDLKRLICEYEQVSEALLMFDHWTRTPMPQQPVMPLEVRKALEMLHPKKRNKS